MPTTLTGIPVDPTTSPQATVAADGDAANSAGLQVTPLQPIVNFISWLRTHIAQKDASNTFSAAQTIAALLTLNASDLVLVAATLQRILKTGGTLQVGTGDANEVDLLVNGVVKFALLAAGGIDAKTQKIVNVIDPTSAQEVATAGYTDTKAAPAKSTITSSATANWSSLGGGSYAPLSTPEIAYTRNGGYVSVHFAMCWRNSTSYVSATNIVSSGAIAATARPDGSVYGRGRVMDSLLGTWSRFVDVSVDKYGNIYVFDTIANNEWVEFELVYLQRH